MYVLGNTCIITVPLSSKCPAYLISTVWYCLQANQEITGASPSPYMCRCNNEFTGMMLVRVYVLPLIEFPSTLMYAYGCQATQAYAIRNVTMILPVLLD